jgi:CrcB protein
MDHAGPARRMQIPGGAFFLRLHGLAWSLMEELALKDGEWVVMQWLDWLLRSKALMLMLGGAIGTYARYALGKWFGGLPWAQDFPYGTFVVNVSGSFILGMAAVIILERVSPAHQDWYLLIGTGFCGGYTTFSTFEWETFKLIRDGSWLYAFANVFGSVSAGFLGVLLGVMVAELIFLLIVSTK